jgi:FtsH-binding integral membrane protein
MNVNHLLKTILHLVCALMVAWYALQYWPHEKPTVALFAVLSLALIGLAFLHQKLWQGAILKTSMFFLSESVVLAAIAWLYYRQGEHRLTFFYEGVSIFFLSLAAFSFILRKKRHVLFSEEEELK